MIVKSLIWSGLAVALPLGVAAVHAESRIVVGDLVAVSGDRPDVPHVESCLAAHPADPNLLFGAAVTFPEANPRAGLEASIVAGFRSPDGGRTWARVPFPECRIDPWVSFGNDRQVYVSCLGRHSSVLVYRSADAGRTWGAPAQVPAGRGGGADRPVLAVGRPAEPRGGTVYVTFGQSSPAPGLREPSYGPSVARSVDGGRTFSPPVFLKHDNLTQQPFDAVVLSSGALAVFFMDYATARETALPHRRTWMAKSRDGGRTFSLPALVHAQLGDEMPWSVAVDRSARRRDRIYLAMDGFWRRDGSGPPEENRAATGNSLLLRVSEDGGEAWRAPVSVTDAPPGANAELPAIAVNGDGVVGVAWSDTRRDPKGECFDIYFTASLDGGATFLPSARITPELSCPKAAGKQRGVASRWAFGGDYSGLAAGADGRFHLFWVDSRTGIYQVWAATARVVP